MGLQFSLGNAVPGETTGLFTIEAALLWGREVQSLWGGFQLDTATVDAGATPTTTLRPGLLLGQKSSNGNLIQYSPNATDGSDIAVGVLGRGVRMLDASGTAVNRLVPVIVAGPVKASSVIGLDEQARGQLAGRIIFDDRNSEPNFFGWSRTIAKTANYTVVNGNPPVGDNNTIFTTTGNAAAITFTLPTTITKGQKWRFYNTVGQNMTVAAPAGKLVTFNNAAATSVSYQTAGNLIGGCFDIIVDETGAFYLAIQLSKNTLTVA